MVKLPGRMIVGRPPGDRLIRARGAIRASIPIVDHVRDLLVLSLLGFLRPSGAGRPIREPEIRCRRRKSAGNFRVPIHGPG